MRQRNVAIVLTGTANLASVRAALLRLGCDVTLADSKESVTHAERLVVPGVGTYESAMRHLDQHDLVEALRDRVLRDRPTLAICLGMQLLAQASEESPGVMGLGILDAVARALPKSVPSPHLGWNRVTPIISEGPVPPGAAYFAHSFALDSTPTDWAAGVTTHGTSFPSILMRGGLLACQFHPELSGSYGQSLIGAWLNGLSVVGREISSC